MMYLDVGVNNSPSLVLQATNVRVRGTYAPVVSEDVEEDCEVVCEVVCEGGCDGMEVEVEGVTGVAVVTWGSGEGACTR